MYKLYKINELASILSITPETIRHYERKGLISPKKSDVNGYRYYDVWDFLLLYRVRAYREYGFALKDIIDIIHDESYESLIEQLDIREKELLKELEKNKQLLNKIKQFHNITQTMVQSIGQYTLTTRPAMYRLEIQKEYELIQDDYAMKQLKEWCMMTPFIFPSIKFYLDADAEVSFTYGQCILEEDARLFHIEENEYITYYPSVPCVHFILKASSVIDITRKDIDPALRFISSQGLQPIDDIIGRWLTVNKNHKKEEEYTAYYDLWIPIRTELKIEE
jgi:DNA-binding transcriptional MerR regulator